ncbi:MAG: hypothetical protein JWQ98_2101 [Chlorobi bacterium]|jgi:hypothetical protein|nr:hypothetical protein [Chlorobiota bacterium]
MQFALALQFAGAGSCQLCRSPDVSVNSNVYQAVMNESNHLLASARSSNTSEKHCEFPAFLVAAAIAGAVLLIIVITVGLGGGFQPQ